MVKKNTTGFIGLTHLGAVASISWASKFDRVIGFDLYEDLVNSFDSGVSAFKEPKMQDMLEEFKEKMEFTKDFRKLSQCNSVFITHDIVTDEKNRSQYKDFYALIDKAIPYLPQNIIIILMSQISVGMTRELIKHIKEKRPKLRFDIIYYVDTLVIGIAFERFLHPERIIIGTEDGTEKVLDDYPFLKRQLNSFDAPVLIMKYESAEMTKICINLYLFTSVMYANIVADLCEKYNADMIEIIPALRLDKRIGKYSYICPSLGVTGGHLERDMRTIERMQKEAKIDSDLIEKIIDFNDKRYRWVEDKLNSHLYPKFKNPKICIFGLAYKKGTASVKNSLAIKIINSLPDKIKFCAYDPYVKELNVKKKIKLFDDPYKAVENSDCLIILTDHDEIKNIDIKKLKGKIKKGIILDCFNIYSHDKQEFKDLNYIAVGRS